MSRHVPVTPGEVARDIASCLPLGINTVHLDARKERGENSNQPDTYAHFIAAVRAVSEEVVICVSCSGRIPSIWEQF